MPVTFTVATHKANRVHVEAEKIASSPHDLVEKTWGKFNKEVKCAELLQSSMGSGNEPAILKNIVARRNGFVDTVIDAYNNHHRLIIRPDDIWMAILGQFNFYVNAHAEALRSSFVTHEGKKELVLDAFRNRYSVDFGDLANQMSDRIDENVVDKDLKAWILPNFTTTTHNDTVICSILMMATCSAYFQFKMDIWCGIPEITVEGEKQDYEKILARLDKLSSFGEEPTLWATVLRSVISRFVSAFDEKPDIHFWSRICDYNAGSGAPYISGWITAFCVWTNEGRWFGPKLSPPPEPDDLPLTDEDYMDPQIFARLEYRRALDYRSKDKSIIDNIEFRSINIADVPVGFCEVEVKVNDNGEEFSCLMVAGHVASTIEGNDSDSLRPSPAWFMFVKG